MSNDEITSLASSIFQNSNNTKLLFTPIVFPSNDNQNMAVVQCIFNSDKLSLSNFGVATAQETGSSNPKDILDAARVDSLNKVAIIASSSSQIVDVECTPIRQDQKQRSHVISEKSKFLGGGAKPISQNQIKFIKGLCTKQRENFDDVAKRICGKDTSELTGADANAIIADLK